MTNQTPNDSDALWIVVLKYVTCYLAWFVISGLGLWILFLLRTNLVEDILFMRTNPWQLRAADKFTVFGLGTVWIVGVMLAEGYLRNGIENGKLWPRVSRLLMIEGTVIALSFAIHTLITAFR